MDLKKLIGDYLGFNSEIFYWQKEYSKQQSLVSERPTHKQERNYFDKDKNFYVWFSWDLKNIYAKEELTTEAKAIFG